MEGYKEKSYKVAVYEEDTFDGSNTKTQDKESIGEEEAGDMSDPLATDDAQPEEEEEACDMDDPLATDEGHPEEEDGGL